MFCAFATLVVDVLASYQVMMFWAVRDLCTWTKRYGSKTLTYLRLFCKLWGYWPLVCACLKVAVAEVFRNFFSQNVIFCLGCIKKFKKLKIPYYFQGNSMGSAWTNELVQMKAQITNCLDFGLICTQVNHHWNTLPVDTSLVLCLSVKIGTYRHGWICLLQKVFPDLSFQLVWSCAVLPVQKVAGEGAVSEHRLCLWHLTWQQGSTFALRRVWWRQKGTPEPFCVLSKQSFPPGHFCGSLLQWAELVCTENCIFVWDSLWLQREFDWYLQSCGLLWSFCSMRHIPLTLPSLAWLFLISGTILKWGAVLHLPRSLESVWERQSVSLQLCWFNVLLKVLALQCWAY